MSLILARETRRLFHLRRLLSRIEVRPKEISIHKEALQPPSQIPVETLSRLGYLYSCSGNVFFRVKDKQIALTLSSVHFWIPSEFAESFGGRIHCGPGRGGSRPTFLWRVCGMKAVEVARVLGPFSWRRKEILDTLSQINERNKKDLHFMHAIQDTLNYRKDIVRKNFFVSPKVSSWSEFAHLLDCRGSIAFVPIYGTIRICIVHPSRELLQSISTFLKAEILQMKVFPTAYPALCFKSGYTSFAWDMQGKVRCYNILREAIDHGLLLQKEKAMELIHGFSMKSTERARLPSRCYHSRLKGLTQKELELSRLIIFFRQQRKRITTSFGSNYLRQSLACALRERTASKLRTEIKRVREEVKILSRQ